MARFGRRLLLLVLLLVFLGFDLCSGQQSPATHHSCSHGHDHHHHHGGNHHHDHREERRKLLPEEIAEEEDLKLGRLHPFELHHSAASSDLSGLGIWIHAMGCSLLVSMASLVCLTIIPILCAHGNPSKAVVDTLALFGAGAMLGDAFLHQLPHAFGGEHSHMHEEHFSHADDHVHSEPSHSHSVKDLSVGLSVLTGIVLFLVVEKIVRFVEEKSNGGHWGHGHHHGKSSKKQKDDDDVRGKMQQQSSETELSDGAADFRSKGEQDQLKSVPKKRNRNASVRDDKSDIDASSGDLNAVKPAMPPSNRVFGYLNLFSDGVHNFTDGMALGSAFLLYGSVGGWSRTLFLLAHELPQEVGDFGILVRSGFSVSKALFFNFLSALVALAGTALALLLGQDPGHSSLIEGFTAGGFIYIAVAGVLAEMNSSGNSSLKATVSQLTSLVSGMGVALYISLIE